jgi:hypothetical protein
MPATSTATADTAIQSLITFGRFFLTFFLRDLVIKAPP